MEQWSFDSSPQLNKLPVRNNRLTELLARRHDFVRERGPREFREFENCIEKIDDREGEGRCIEL